MSQQKIQMYRGKTVEKQLRKAEELLCRKQDAGRRGETVGSRQ